MRLLQPPCPTQKGRMPGRTRHLLTCSSAHVCKGCEDKWPRAPLAWMKRAVPKKQSLTLGSLGPMHAQQPHAWIPAAQVGFSPASHGHTPVGSTGPKCGAGACCRAHDGCGLQHISPTNSHNSFTLRMYVQQGAQLPVSEVMAC